MVTSIFREFLVIDLIGIGERQETDDGKEYVVIPMRAFTIMCKEYMMVNPTFHRPPI
jgi:hypothetical protein